MKNLGKIGFIGGGNMGCSIIGGLISKGYSPHKIWVGDHGEKTCSRLQEKFEIHATINNIEVVNQVDILVLAVKPSSMKEVINQLKAYINPEKCLLISIAAGITTSLIQKWLDKEEFSLIRAMPNLPALVGEGITGLYATKSISSLQRAKAEQLMQAVGEGVWVKNEDQMDIVTALSGSGPAYFFYMMEGLIKAGIKLGLSPEMANKLTLHTALGSAKIALQSEEAIEELRKKVTSKGGTTEAGIEVLKNGKLPSLLEETLVRACERSKALSK